VRVLEVDPLAGKNSLEPLLDGLLCMEAQDAVRDVCVARELTQRYGVLGCLPSKDASSRGSSSGDDTAVSEGFVHQRAGNGAPSLCMLGADNDQVDRNPHGAQRFTQPHELGATTLQLRLNHEQIEIRPRLGVSARMGAKEDYPRIGGSHGQATASLSDQLFVGHRIKVADDRDGLVRLLLAARLNF